MQAAGVSQDSPRGKQAHLRVPTDQNTTKIPREDSQREKKDTRRSPERGEKNKNCGGKEKKKRDILGGPAEGGPAELGPSGAGARERPLAKIGLTRPKSAQIGQVKGCGQSRRGQSRPQPFWERGGRGSPGRGGAFSGGGLLRGGGLRGVSAFGPDSFWPI